MAILQICSRFFARPLVSLRRRPKGDVGEGIRGGKISKTSYLQLQKRRR